MNQSKACPKASKPSQDLKTSPFVVFMLLIIVYFIFSVQFVIEHPTHLISTPFLNHSML